MSEHERLLQQSQAEDSEEEAKTLSTLPPTKDLSRDGAKLLQSLHDASFEHQLAHVQAAGASVVYGMVKDCLGTTCSAYTLTVIVNLARTDAQVYKLLPHNELARPLMGFLKNCRSSYEADRAAYLLTAITWQAGSGATAGVGELAVTLMSGGLGTSKVGGLDGLVNLLKDAEFRHIVWPILGVQKAISDARSESPVPVVYKTIFAIWLISAEPSMIGDLQRLGAVTFIKRTLATSRTEKVVRVSLLALQNLAESLAEDVLEAQLLESVEALEYEKWRDPEVYALIKSVLKMIRSALTEHSNYQRYLRDLKKSDLKWSFIHSDKFWLENYMQFDKDDFAAVKLLVDKVGASNDAETKAVCCHDIGEFARLHPSGKSVLGRWPRAKIAVMECMGHENREVAREALLAVQKLMLNSWQDLEK